MRDYDERPWLALYGDQPADYEIEFDDALSMFRAGLARDPSGDAPRGGSGHLMASGFTGEPVASCTFSGAAA